MKSYKELRTAPRIDLALASPLPAPLTVYIEPTNVCNFGCQMCPETLPDYAERAGYYQAMEWLTYTDVIADIKELGGVKSLKFYFEGEPLLNKRLPEMISYAKAQGIAERLELTTNGSLLTAPVSRALVQSGLDYVQVSIYSVLETDHTRITGQRRFLPELIRDRVHALVQAREEAGTGKPFIHAKLMWDSEEGRRAFEHQYSEVADEISVQATHNWMGDVQYQTPLVNIGEAPVNQKQVCPFPFYMLTVKANGDVSVCCVDWSGKLVLGNVMQQSLKQMWEGERMKQIRLAHLSGKRDSLFACRDCDALFTSPDNLDSLTAKEYQSRCR
jgi:radical SAM protein with 4Fe4S-binding SPASM domain